MGQNLLICLRSGPTGLTVKFSFFLTRRFSQIDRNTITPPSINWITFVSNIWNVWFQILWTNRWEQWRFHLSTVNCQHIMTIKQWQEIESICKSSEVLFPLCPTCESPAKPPPSDAHSRNIHRTLCTTAACQAKIVQRTKVLRWPVELLLGLFQATFLLL